MSRPAGRQWGEQDSNLRRLSQCVYSRISFSHSDIPPSVRGADCRAGAESPVACAMIVRSGQRSTRWRDSAARVRAGTTTPLAIITDALLHDPGWLAVGPDRAGHRRACARATTAPPSASCTATAGPIYGAFRDGSSPASPSPSPPAATRRRPGPSSATSRASCSPGPAPIVRGLRASSVQDRGHPEEEHVFLWFLAVDPAHQRSGVGRALLARVFEDAEAPVYLDTANPANVPYYASLGLRGDRPRRAAARRDHVVHEAPRASLSRCASGRPSSFFSVLFSIWRMRSRVTPNARPTSSSVRALLPRSP